MDLSIQEKQDFHSAGRLFCPSSEMISRNQIQNFRLSSYHGTEPLTRLTGGWI